MYEQKIIIFVHILAVESDCKHSYAPTVFIFIQPVDEVWNRVVIS